MKNNSSHKTQGVVISAKQKLLAVYSRRLDCLWEKAKEIERAIYLLKTRSDLESKPRSR